MKIPILVVLALSIAGSVAAQDLVDTAEVLARVKSGGRFEETKWRRGDNGALEMHYFADMGVKIPGPLRFQPLLGKGLERGLRNAGVVGFLAMVCHGPDDLLSMTDAEFHLGAMGVDTTDVGLRQYLALEPPSFEFGSGRAELFDRMLAVDLLVRRGCKSAVAELQMIARSELPRPLRDRARYAVDRLDGRAATVARRRLAPDTLNLPLVFDCCVIVDHSRLPDISWLTPLTRRLGMLITASRIEAAGGELTAAQCNGAQVISDVVGELPFGLAHQYGNARLDHSCLVINAKVDPKLPVSLSWQAVGEFEHEGWQGAVVAERLLRNNPLLGGKLVVTADRVQATVGGGAGKPRPEKAVELLRDTGLAIRAIVPKTSKLWPMLRVLDLPPAMGAELRLTFGDPAVIVLMVEARDEDDAEEWASLGKEMLAQAKQSVARQLPESLRENADVKRLLTALFGAAISVKDSAAFAVVELKGITPAIAGSIVEDFVLGRRF